MTNGTYNPQAGTPSLFSQLIIMLATSTMQQLGKIVNPLTQKAETDIEGARASIDLIEMLEEKTRGNLDAAETKLIGDTLTSLRLNYVETARDVQTKPEEQKEDAGPEEGAQEPAEQIETKSDDADEKKPKFHKTYE
jgi:hypothetical protein